jgi:hypothetical protein
MKDHHMSHADLVDTLNYYKNRLGKVIFDTDKIEMQALIANLEKQVIIAAKREADEAIHKRETRLIKKIEKAGIDYAEWISWAKSLYKIHRDELGNMRVISMAKEWIGEMSWQVDSEVGALEKIYKLIEWKKADRERGHGDIVEDLSKVIK